jgi:hypothetical protein
MERKIFDMNLSVEAVSLFLILEDLEATGGRLTREACLERWNAPAEALDRAIEELRVQQVVDEAGGVLAMRPAGEWLEAKEA